MTLHPLIAELRRTREARGISQQLLADRLGLNRMTITSWENGWRQPKDLAELQRWAGTLGHTLTLIPQAKEQAA